MYENHPSTRVHAVASLAICFCLAAIAANPSTAHTLHHRRHNAEVRHRSERRSNYHALRSRGVVDTRIPDTQTVVGRLGVVTDDNVQIVAPREEYGRVLSTVGKGTSITITGETDTYYAVLMIDRSMGLIPKDKVQLLDYEVTASQTGAQGGPLGQALVQTAVKFMGVPYVYGGETTDGIDCSAFVQSVYSANGMSLPRTAHEQANVGYAVSTTDPSQWIPGDRIYFQCHHDYIDHAGMYIGNGYFIHSSVGNHGVNVDRIDNKYYWDHIVTVRRSPELQADIPQTNADSVRTADDEASQE